MNKSDRKRSPQENKRLSYERDCINRYGENDKSSRKAIRRFKAASNRVSRRGVNQTLQGLEQAPEEAAHETALLEAEHLALRPRKVKRPDTRLKDVVPYKARAAANWASTLRSTFEEFGETGLTSLPNIASELERRRIATPHGKQWSAWLVQRALMGLGVKRPWEWNGRLD